MSEARNLRNMTMVQTPLLGEENTPVHVGPAGGTGFEGATPRHQVAFTPNPLATPMRAGGGADVGATPRDLQRVGATPLRTPMRDSLSINEEGYAAGAVVGDTPREQRIHLTSTKRALQAGFSSLPKPENNFELLVPEDEDDGEGEGGERVMMEEDAAERDARARRMREEEERKALARRTQAVQHGLPRPPNVDVEQLLAHLSISAEDEPSRLVNAELAALLRHDSIAFPLPGTALAGGTRSAYEIPADEDIASAKAAIQQELGQALGYPDANVEQLKQGLSVLSAQEEADESLSWASLRPSLAFNISTSRFVAPDALDPEARIQGLAAQLNECREAMAKEAQRAAKTEKKLNVTLGGYQARAKALARRVVDGFEELGRTEVDRFSFAHLRANEEATGPARVGALKEEVERLEVRERALQGRYAELETERREAEARVAAVEDRLMAEAEALNEAALAEMEDAAAEA